jgi:NADPH2:quinone reductase
MSHAIVLHKFGGPEQLRWEEHPVGPPGAGEVRIRHAAVGVNFIDIYNRSGLYPLPLPAVLGQEAAGVVLEVGAKVTSLRPGDRIGYAGTVGSYAEERLVAADRLVRLPDDLPDQEAAALILKGLTADMLLSRVHSLAAGEAILFNAAAGGVGQLACRWAKALGALVIGTVGSQAKVAAARAAGCDHVIVTDDPGLKTLAAQVRELTGGAGVRVAYDSVGGALLDASLDCIAPRGLLVTFGQSSGKVPLLDTAVMASRGSLFATRPSIRSYYSTPVELQEGAQRLFAAVRAGHVKPAIGARFPLREAALAHRELEARRTTGATVLLPG